MNIDDGVSWLYLTPETRASIILETVHRTGKVSVEKLAAKIQTSAATIRRDLSELERRGLLKREHGSAVAMDPVVHETFRADSSFQEQIRRMADEKRRIGVAAAKLIRAGQTVAFGAGTTTTHVVRALPPVQGVTAVTNTLNIALELSRRNEIKIFVTGGMLNGGWFSLTGPTALNSLREMYFDQVFFSVTGIHPERGLTDSHPEEAAVNRLFLKQARRKIVVADHTKFSIVANNFLSPLEDIDLIITDTGASERALAAYRKRGVEIQRV
jgi:DeoR family transcriptional regulator, aga operon transcriptional repressor